MELLKIKVLTPTIVGVQNQTFIRKYNLMGAINRGFGENLRKLREKHKFTQEQLAQLSEVDYKYIQRLEGKKPSSPSLNTIEKLAKAFKIHPSQLLKF